MLTARHWLIHFVKRSIDLATAWLEDYGPFVVARCQITEINIYCYFAIVHFLWFHVWCFEQQKIHLYSVLFFLKEEYDSPTLCGT